MLVADPDQTVAAPEALILNSSVLTPRGFRPRPTDPVRTGIVHGPDAPSAGPVRGGTGSAAGALAADTPGRPVVRVEVPAGPLLGQEHLRVLHGLGLVIVDEQSRPGPRDTATLVAGLALAGVPVATRGCSARARAFLPADLLEITDEIDAATVRDPGRRELVSLRLRRCADRHYGYRVSADPEHPVVAVLVEAGEASTESLQQLMDDLSAQTWPEVRLHRLPFGDGAEPAEAGELARAGEAGALYVTRMVPGLRYGPHHLADLVAALARSGRPVAHSPARFRLHPRHRLVVEDRGAEGDVIGTDGLTGGSLWYAADGPAPPITDGYVVHGCNAVAHPAASGTDPGDLPVSAERGAVLHRTPPIQLDWLATGAEPATGVPASYFGTPTLVDARS